VREEVGKPRAVEAVQAPPFALRGLERVDVAGEAREAAQEEGGVGAVEGDDGEPGHDEKKLLDDAEEPRR
jgi:hypothetical protein